jgi:hypothetical protein
MEIPTTAIAAIVQFAVAVGSCKEKEPAGRAGERIDGTVEEIKDTVDPKELLEKAGEKVGEALGE